MKKWYFFLFVIFLTAVIGFFSYKATYSFFSDTEVSTGNSITAVIPTPTPTPTPGPGDIVINEVSSDGNEKKEWVELFNKSSLPINVNGWKIRDGNQTDIFPSVSSIPAGGYAVIIANNTDVTGIPSSAITIQLTDSDIGNGLNNNGDELHLQTSSDVTIDEMSYGNDTDVFISPPAAPDTNESVARSPNGVDTNTGADWVVDTTPSMGVAN